MARVVKDRGKLYHFHLEGCLSLPAKGEIVIHLRLGDTVHKIDHIHKTYRNFIGKDVTIVSNAYRTRKEGSKGSERKSKSLEYIQNLTRFLQRDTNQIRQRTCLPDEDFVYMAHAAHFRHDSGGFSLLVSNTNIELRKLIKTGEAKG